MLLAVIWNYIAMHGHMNTKISASRWYYYKNMPRLSYRARCFHCCFVCQHLHIAAYSLVQLCFKHPSTQGCTNPRRHGAVATTFCTVALTVCESHFRTSFMSPYRFLEF